MIETATSAEANELATLMAGSELLQRYRVTESSALQSLVLAIEEGDVVLVHRDSSVIKGRDVGLNHHDGSAINASDTPLVHSDGSRIDGMAWLTFAPRVLNGAAYLRLLLVADGRRGAGVGAQLLSEVERRAIKQHANHMYLLATSDNHAARRFYERHGYRCVGELPGLVWPDLDEVLYHKPLRRMNNVGD